MRKVLLLSQIMMFWCAITCVAQQNLFTWVDGNVVANSNYIVYNQQPTGSRFAHILSKTKVLHTLPVSSANNEYECDILIVGTQGIEEDGSHCYNQFDIKSKSGSLIFRRRGIGPLTRTFHLSCDYNDVNYFRKIDLNNDSYALFFTGWCSGIDDDLGEMVIVVVSKNVATLVYDGPAAAITPTNFNSSSFTMDFVTDGTGLKDIETGLLDITPEKLVGKTKYRLYKDGDVLKIVSWITGNGPALP